MHIERRIELPDAHILSKGYSAEKAERELAGIRASGPIGVFVNSTIALEGVVHWLKALPDTSLVRSGCFDWDPFAALLPGNVAMVEQDVTGMLDCTFSLMGEASPPPDSKLVPCILRLSAAHDPAHDRLFSSGT